MVQSFFCSRFYIYSKSFLNQLHSIESKHEVTILGGLNEFVVKFFGPQGSKFSILYVTKAKQW